MRFVSFSRPDAEQNPAPHLGVLLDQDREILDVFSALKVPEHTHKARSSYLEWFDLDGDLFPQIQNVVSRAAECRDDFEKSILKRSDVKLLAPVPFPGKVICIGLNYRDHAIESGMDIPENPLVFSKFPTSVTGPDEPIILPEGSEKADYEAEMAVVVGKRTKNVSADEAFDYVFGYTNLNDVSERGFQFADGQWQRGKSCDTFAPTGPFIATKDEIPDPHSLSIKLRLNGETLQDSSTNQLIFNVPELISYLSKTVTLEPGDLIATGTPPGVGFARKPPVYLKKGDIVEVEVEGLGTLSNPVE
ncbi:MAG: fumarylacetoacetate hydrolase family protein [Pyrinomonadaceae bacterium]